MSRYIYNYNPVEIAFSVWVRNYPESPHPLDDKRFFEFVWTCCSYKKSRDKWSKDDYFVGRCRKAGLIDEECLNKKATFVKDFAYMVRLTTRPIKRKTIRRDYRGFDYEMCYADKESHLHFVKISKEEYETGGITLSEMKRRESEPKGSSL